MKSRILKFRAWNFINEEMTNDLVNLFIIHPDSIGENYHTLQFTGLLDKNGKEIFEGDIVNVLVNTNSQNYIGKHDNDLYYTMKVEFNHQGYFDMVNITPKRKGKYNPSSLMPHSRRVHFDTIEIIGNIFENKELLKCQL